MSNPIEALQALVKKLKTKQAAADYLGVKRQFVSAILGGTASMPESMAEKLGLKKKWVRK